MTPGIFRRKWCAKFDDYVGKLSSDVLTPARMYTDCDKGSDLFNHFRAEANELSLTPHSFPSCGPDATDDSAWPKDNPFVATTTMFHFVGAFLCKLRSMKRGAMVNGFVWTDVCLRDQQRIEDLFVWFDRGIEAGLWIEAHKHLRNAVLEQWGWKECA